jgi:hypothetical protein
VVSALRRIRLASALTRGRAGVEALRRRAPARRVGRAAPPAATPPSLPAGARAFPAADALVAASPEELAGLRAALALELGRLADGEPADRSASLPSRQPDATRRTRPAASGAATDETAFRYHSHFRNAAPPSL